MLSVMPKRSATPLRCSRGLLGVGTAARSAPGSGGGGALGGGAAPGGGGGGGVRLSARSLQLTLRTEGGRPVVLRASAAASPLFYVQVIPLKWFLDRSTGRERRAAGLDAPHVVALGQCALGKGVLTVDARQRRAVWEQTT